MCVCVSPSHRPPLMIRHHFIFISQISNECQRNAHLGLEHSDGPSCSLLAESPSAVLLFSALIQSNHSAGTNCCLSGQKQKKAYDTACAHGTQTQCSKQSEGS